LKKECENIGLKRRCFFLVAIMAIPSLKMWKVAMIRNRLPTALSKPSSGSIFLQPLHSKVLPFHVVVSQKPDSVDNPSSQGRYYRAILQALVSDWQVSKQTANEKSDFRGFRCMGIEKTLYLLKNLGRQY